MKTIKKPWELTSFVVSYTSVKHVIILGLFSLALCIPATSYAGKRPHTWAQNTFLVQPKRSQSTRSVSKLEEKAKSKASSLYGARALSAQYIGKSGSMHSFKVKLRKNGRIFFKTVKVQ